MRHQQVYWSSIGLHRHPKVVDGQDFLIACQRLRELFPLNVLHVQVWCACGLAEPKSLNLGTYEIGEYAGKMLLSDPARLQDFYLHFKSIFDSQVCHARK